MNRFVVAAVRGRDDRGSIALEVAILAPALIFLIVLGVAAGRTVLASNVVADAAHDAARAASLARNGSDARADATRTARDTLDGRGQSCVTSTTTVDTSGFNQPGGQPASVAVTVTCVVSYADLVGVPGVPGTRVVSASFVSPLDQYRGRS